MINEGSHTTSSEATNLIANGFRSLKKPSVQSFYSVETPTLNYPNILEKISLSAKSPSIYPVHTVHNQELEAVRQDTQKNPVHTPVHTVSVSSTEAVKALKPSDELYEVYELGYEVRIPEVENPEVQKTQNMKSMKYLNRKQKVRV